MKKIEIFKNKDFGQIRTTVNENGEPMFCLRDACNVLGLRVSNVVQRLEDKVFSKYPISDSIGRQRMVNFVNEDGLYDVILESRKPEARKFRKWITSEVLPSIRRNGLYATDEALERLTAQPEYAQKVLNKMKVERMTKQQMLSVNKVLVAKMNLMKPLADYCNTVLATKDTVTVTQIAQDYGYTARAFNRLLRDMKIQFRINEQWMLYADIKRNGYVQSGTRVYTRFDGKKGIEMVSRWTQEGRLFLYRRLKEYGILPVMERQPNAAASELTDEEIINRV